MKKKSTEQQDPPPGLILKYPNRRMYCTVESRYLTLNDINQRIQSNKPVCIVLKKTGANITRVILLELLKQFEEHGEGRQSEADLCRLIRASPFIDRTAEAA